ncbi:hypothetical protein [Mycobacteroides salmoniphilum]|uniref:hypothetical protein n=1 Tax=Mycobacteroides salmoniphilum TaxID=404941 RepID=UPI000993C423|nr:hypothetical protein [Mycobacteroides salmoniphilum]
MPTEAELEDMLKKIQEKLDELRKWPEKLREKFEWAANTWLARLKSGLSDLIRQAGNLLIQALNKCIDLLDKIVKSIFVIPRLFYKSSQWSDISGKANTAGADITAIPGKLDDYWKGDAATNYSQAVGPQSTAAGRIGSISNSMRTSSLTVAGAGVVFGVAVVGATVTLIVALGAAAAAAATVVGAPPAGAAGGVAATTWVGIVTALVGGVTALTVAQGTQISNLHAELQSGAGFPNGGWPKATANGEYSDASVTDGDGTDWKYKVS